MEPVWEYQYEIDDWSRLRPTQFYLTDEEAARWPRINERTTRRLDETKRDRNLVPPPPDLSTGMPQRRRES
jgi:hypothetical protein